MKKTILTTAFLLALAGITSAQELQPQDYSPTEDAAIRTLGLKSNGNGRWTATVAIANRSAKPFDSNFDCTLFDKDGQPFDNAGGGVSAVPPGQEIVAKTSSFAPKPEKVACRIEFTNPTD